jgi:hypothetical protein
MAQDKPSSEQLRSEAEKLRATAVELMEHAATLIAKSAELEKKIIASKKRDKKIEKARFVVGPSLKFGEVSRLS